MAATSLFEKLFDTETTAGIARFSPCGTNIAAIMGASPYPYTYNFDASSPRFSGWSSMRVESREGFPATPCGDSTHRAEPVYYEITDSLSDFGINWWCGLSIKLDLNWPSYPPGGNTMIMQWKKHGGGLAELAFYATVRNSGSGTLGSPVTITIHSTAYDTAWRNDRTLPGSFTLPRGQWADLIIQQYRIRRATNGIFRVWRNIGTGGYQLVWQYTGATGYYGPSDYPGGGHNDVSHKFGMYHGPSPYDSVITIHNTCAFRIATSPSGDDSGFDAVDPTGSEPPPDNLAPPVFDPPATLFDTSIVVSLSSPDDPDEIYWTDDGSDPDSGDNAYSSTGPITLTATTTLKAIAVKSGFTDSAISEATYTLAGATDLLAPVIDPPGGDFETEVEVTISSAQSPDTIYYTLDGSDPDTGSTEYTGPFTLTATTTVKTYCVKSGWTDSPIASADFTLIDLIPPPYVPRPSKPTGIILFD